MKAKRTWILVADGGRARIVRLVEVKADIEGQLEDLIFEIDHKQLRDIMSDRPGRSFASVGARRSAMEYHSDPVQEQEGWFAATLLAELERRHAGHEFESLAIIAEPRMLSAIRQKLSPSLRRTIVGEVAKDLTKLPRQELLEAITELGIVR